MGVRSAGTNPEGLNLEMYYNTNSKNVLSKDQLGET